MKERKKPPSILGPERLTPREEEALFDGLQRGIQASKEDPEVQEMLESIVRKLKVIIKSV